jgi:hypothetical protein
MNAKQFHAAIDLSTSAALTSGECSLPEIVGILHMAALNAERVAYNHAMRQAVTEGVPESKPKLILPPNGIRLPKR